MPPTRPPYPSELKRQIVELVRAGRSPSELAKEFEPWVQTEVLFTYGLRSVNKTIFYDPNYSEVAPAYMENRSMSFCIGLGFPYGKTGG